MGHIAICLHFSPADLCFLSFTNSGVSIHRFQDGPLPVNKLDHSHYK